MKIARPALENGQGQLEKTQNSKRRLGTEISRPNASCQELAQNLSCRCATVEGKGLTVPAARSVLNRLLFMNSGLNSEV